MHCVSMIYNSELYMLKALKEGDELMNTGRLKQALPYYEKVMQAVDFKVFHYVIGNLSHEKHHDRIFCHIVLLDALIRIHFISQVYAVLNFLHCCFTVMSFLIFIPCFFTHVAQNKLRRLNFMEWLLCSGPSV